MYSMNEDACDHFSTMDSSMVRTPATAELHIKERSNGTKPVLTFHFLRVIVKSASVKNKYKTRVFC